MGAQSLAVSGAVRDHRELRNDEQPDHAPLTSPFRPAAARAVLLLLLALHVALLALRAAEQLLRLALREGRLRLGLLVRRRRAAFD